MKTSTLVALLSTVLLISTETHADLYLTTGLYYSKVAKPIDRHGSGSSVGIGYQLNDSWDIELSYDQLIDKNFRTPTEVSGQLELVNGYQHQGVTLSAIGKAEINASTTLFYRAGVSHNDIDYMSFTSGDTSCHPDAYWIINFRQLNEQNAVVHRATGCGYQDKSTDVLFGLGVESEFTEHWFGRIEAIGYFANKGENITTAKLSIGYRF